MLDNETRIKEIESRLRSAMEITELVIHDQSAHHAGHPGAQTGMGHFAISIASPAFENHSVVSNHRMIYDALGDLMETDIHAVQITIL